MTRSVADQSGMAFASTDLTLEQKVALARGFQTQALAIIAEGIEVLDGGAEPLLAKAPSLRLRMGEALGGYQILKHRLIFDPAITSGTDAQIRSAKAMKAACIEAGELFRSHMRAWDIARIQREWSIYKPAARLIAGQLRRHLLAEAEGVIALLDREARPDPSRSVNTGP